MTEICAGFFRTFQFGPRYFFFVQPFVYNNNKFSVSLDAALGSPAMELQPFPSFHHNHRDRQERHPKKKQVKKKIHFIFCAGIAIIVLHSNIVFIFLLWSITAFVCVSVDTTSKKG